MEGHLGEQKKEQARGRGTCLSSARGRLSLRREWKVETSPSAVRRRCRVSRRLHFTRLSIYPVELSESREWELERVFKAVVTVTDKLL